VCVVSTEITVDTKNGFAEVSKNLSDTDLNNFVRIEIITDAQTSC